MSKKCILIIKGKKINVSPNYDNNPLFTVLVLKRGGDLYTFYTLEKLPKMNYVKPEKQKNVKNLIWFFLVPDDVSGFYKDIFKLNEIFINAEDVLFLFLLILFEII